MTKPLDTVRLLVAGLTFALFFCLPLAGQSSSPHITPGQATMLVGDSQSFRLVDSNGQMQRRVSWSTSDPDALSAREGDELTIVANRPGTYRITARSPNGGDEATVTVLEGQTIPQGTVKWSAGNEGCTTTKIIPAVPSANGPDVFEQSQCEDGEYISAYSSEGTQLWRRKISDRGAPRRPASAGNNTPMTAPGRPLSLRTPSVCDSIAQGTSQDKVRELLSSRKLSFTERQHDHVWVIEEPSARCELSFANSAVTRKRKILVNE